MIVKEGKLTFEDPSFEAYIKLNRNDYHLSDEFKNFERKRLHLPFASCSIAPFASCSFAFAEMNLKIVFIQDDCVKCLIPRVYYEDEFQFDVLSLKNEVLIDYCLKKEFVKTHVFDLQEGGDIHQAKKNLFCLKAEDGKISVSIEPRIVKAKKEEIPEL